ncbi:hypothetical protein FOZ62_009626, partial [Perkinsus olseni]
LVASSNLNPRVSTNDDHSNERPVGEERQRCLERQRTQAAETLEDCGRGSVFESSRRAAFGSEKIDKVRIFMDLAAELSPRERLVREAAKHYKIPLFDAEDVWKKFKKVCSDDSSTIGKKEFEALLLQLLKMPALRPSKLEEWWRSVDTRQRGKIDFVEFLRYYWPRLRVNPM